MLTSTILCFETPDPRAWEFTPGLAIAVRVHTDVERFREPYWRYFVRSPLAAVELRWEWNESAEMQEGAVNEVAYRLGGAVVGGHFERLREPLARIDIAELAAGLAAHDPAARSMLAAARTLRHDWPAVKERLLAIDAALAPLLEARKPRGLGAR